MMPLVDRAGGTRAPSLAARGVRAACAAAAAATIAGATVYTGFDAGRTKAVQSPIHAVGGDVVVPAVAPPPTVALRPPFAVIARSASPSISF